MGDSTAPITDVGGVGDTQESSYTSTTTSDSSSGRNAASIAAGGNLQNYGASISGQTIGNVTVTDDGAILAADQLVEDTTMTALGSTDQLAEQAFVTEQAALNTTTGSKSLLGFFTSNAKWIFGGIIAIAFFYFVLSHENRS